MVKKENISTPIYLSIYIYRERDVYIYRDRYIHTVKHVCGHRTQKTTREKSR